MFSLRTLLSKLLAVVLFILIYSQQAYLFSNEDPAKILFLDLVDVSDNKTQYKYFSKSIPDSLESTMKRKYNTNPVSNSLVNEKLNNGSITEDQLNDAETVQDLGKQSGADNVVFGTYNVIDNEVNIELKLLNVKSGNVLYQDEDTVPIGTKVFEIVDSFVEESTDELNIAPKYSTRETPVEEPVAANDDENDSFSALRPAMLNIGVLPVYNLTTKKFGAEIRFGIEKSFMNLPSEWLYINGNLRVRLWPMFFLQSRNSPYSQSPFLSLYTESVFGNDRQSEIGIGGGYSFNGINIAIWITSTFYNTEPSTREIYALRFKGTYDKPNYYARLGFSFGSAVLNNSTTTASTEGSVFKIEPELGYHIVENLILLVASEIRIENFGGNFDSGAKVSQVSNGSEVLMKLGINYKFSTGW